MAHGITSRDGVFAVREPMWHGLGVVLPDHPDRAQAQAIAHPWEPVSEPIFRKVLAVSDPGFEGDEGRLTERFEEVPEYVLNARSDDGGTLGVVSSTYQTVTNSEMYDIAEAIDGEGHGQVQYETGGSLRGGAKVWLLLRLREPLVVPGDPNGATIPYYGLQNQHDGMGAFRGQCTMVRIVCENTSQMADLDAQARGTEFVFRHTKNVRDKIEQARAALAGWRDSIDRWRLVTEHLVDVTLTREQVETFISEFVPMPPPHATSNRVVQNVEDARGTLRTILASETCEGIEQTAYGMVQASVEYLQHYRRAQSTESRFKRAYLDRNRIVSDAHRLALEVAVS